MANAENIQKWTAALRSGEFSQASGALRKGDNFCCLGVACEVYRRETGLGVWDPNVSEPDALAFEKTLTDPEAGISDYDDLRATNWELLPDPVSDWLGLDGDDDPKLDLQDEAPDCASHLNDKGTPFAVLADAIERTFLARASRSDETPETRNA